MTRRKLLALAGGLFCFALILVPLLWRPQQQVGPRAQAPKTAPSKKKSVGAWNVALGNVVMVSSELGLSIKSPNKSTIDRSRLVTMIDSRLTSVREIYRAESEKQSGLMGGIFIEFTVGDGGRVTRVQEVASRIGNSNFRKAVSAEVEKWNFNDTLPEGVTVRCPLLFIREGMEITTVVNWEKSLGLFNQAPIEHAASSEPARVGKVVSTRAPQTNARVDEDGADTPAREFTRARKPAARPVPISLRTRSENPQPERDSRGSSLE